MPVQIDHGSIGDAHPSMIVDAASDVRWQSDA